MRTGEQRKAAAEILAKAKPKTATVAFVLDGDLLTEHATLHARLNDAVDIDATSADAVALAEEILELDARMADAEVTFVLQGMGRGRWRKLAADNPPEEGSLSRFGVDFPFKAVAACLVEPELTVEELQQLEDEVFDETQFGKLWAACLLANVGDDHPETEAARSVLQSVRLKSGPPSDSESAEAS